MDGRLGPLLYHHENSADEVTLELTAEEFMHAVRSYGFEVTCHDGNMENCHYARNRDSMFTFHYKCLFFTARKQRE